MYAGFFKRIIDFLLALTALCILSPVLVILMIVGAIAMGGNPFFTQLRPGRIDKKTGKERIFKLVKFRTMSNKKDAHGNLLPDKDRLNKYGRILRSTSLDELPELWNILIGDMSLIGPRPLLPEYLPWYTEEERHRHDVRPGLTGLAQVHGRNNVAWERRFQLDVEYVRNISFINDVKIILLTIKKVLAKSDVSEDTSQSEGNFAEIRRKQQEQNEDMNHGA
ncbi:MAG: sugar transferase [Ruminococcaceae bacterium]|nr:sugar transferase [Oscillospiraceae bacterium]